MEHATIIRRKDTTFIRLPANAQTKIKGGCQCPYCKDHPHREPMWDTVATDGNSVWTVHYPDMGA